MRGTISVALTAALLLSLSLPAGASDTQPDDAADETASGQLITTPVVGVRPLDSACDVAPRARFSDRDRAGVHTPALDCVSWWRVTGGFPDNTFRPDGTVSRGQMATFISSAILAAGGQLPAPGPELADTGSTVHRRAIARLSAAGIVGGFPDGTFRPSNAVTRGQMATFLVGALDHLEVAVPVEATSATRFEDVAGTTHADRIARATVAGIAGGFDDGTYRPGAPVRRHQMATFLARLLATVTDSGVPRRAAHAAIDHASMREEVCRPGPADVERAEAFLDGRYHFSPHREVTLGTDLSWGENPLDDNNWQFQFHTMRWLRPIIGAASKTGELRYLDHAYAMARSWVERNPFDAPPSPYSWNDHSAAWRTLVFSCLAMQGPIPDWLDASLREHRDRMADPSFYVRDGNHALNQDAGMLAAACLTDAWDLRDLASERIARLALESVDDQGVTNEQAVEYQDYNYERYLAALHLLESCGVPTPPWAHRLQRMPVVLAHMVQPDGTYVPLGDTDRRRAKFAFEHPNMRWMSTAGDSGEPPQETFVSFDAGFTFARSGWGVDRHRLEENLLSVRHGPPRQLHGHLDHGSITLFADGQPLLTDPGKFAYGATPQHRHVVSQEAHNLVTIAGCAPSSQRPSPVEHRASDDHVDRLTVRVATCEGTGWTRGLAFVRATGEVVVIDEVDAGDPRDVVQRWQLEVEANVAVIRPDLVFAAWPSGATLLVEQLRPVASTTSVAGGSNPLRGWVSERYGELTPAANLQFTAPTGSETVFVTVLRPGASSTSPASTVERTTAQTVVTLTTGEGVQRTITLPRARP